MFISNGKIPLMGGFVLSACYLRSFLIFKFILAFFAQTAVADLQRDKVEDIQILIENQNIDD